MPATTKTKTGSKAPAAQQYCVTYENYLGTRTTCRFATREEAKAFKQGLKSDVWSVETIGRITPYTTRAMTAGR